jgi:hypothetical protein
MIIRTIMPKMQSQTLIGKIALIVSAINSKIESPIRPLQNINFLVQPFVNPPIAGGFAKGCTNPIPAALPCEENICIALCFYFVRANVLPSAETALASFERGLLT